MYKMMILLLTLFATGCSTSPSSVSIKNANGNISWASGTNQQIYIPDSKRTIALISKENVIAFNGGLDDKNEPCKSYYNDKLKIHFESMLALACSMIWLPM